MAWFTPRERAGWRPRPTKYDACSTKGAKLLKLTPQLSVPLMVVGLIDVLLAFLEGMQNQFNAVVAGQVKTAQAAMRAAQLGNVQLMFEANALA
jgi:hypothetical protein